MGLDLVEIAMRIEEEFEITFSDEDAADLYTPGDVINYLMTLPKVYEKRSRDFVSNAVWKIVEEEGGIKRENFNDDSRFIEDMGID